MLSTGSDATPGCALHVDLTNDKWLGDFYHATDRTKSRNLIEEGQFYGVQSGPWAISLYTPPRSPGVISSARRAPSSRSGGWWTSIWIGGWRMASLPAEAAPGEVIVVGSGSRRQTGGAWIAILPLAHTDSGRDVRIRLVER